MLPVWLYDISEINTASGLEHCGTEEDYIDALSVFQASGSQKASEIEGFLKSGDYSMYTLRVHSLKSMASLIGAGRLSEMAYALELAGKNNDISVIKKDTAALLEAYRVLYSHLEPLKEEIISDKIQTSHEPISDEALQDAYASISDCISCYDDISIRTIMDALSTYDLPKAALEKLSKTDKELKSNNWKSLRELYGISGKE